VKGILNWTLPVLLCQLQQWAKAISPPSLPEKTK
jgi:hypothetical protein